MTFDRAAFPRQLRYWTLHCGINALPSFIIACFWMDLWEKPVAVAAMLAAIATFILLYTTLTSLRGPLSDSSHILSRSLKLGARIRAIITLCSLPLFSFEAGMMFTPDLWCGFASVAIINSIFNQAGRAPGIVGLGSGSSPTFLPIYSTTLLEGFILSFLLLMISFFALIFLQIRERRKAFAALPDR